MAGEKYVISIGTLPAFQGRPEEVKTMYLAIGYDNELAQLDTDTFNIRVADLMRMLQDEAGVATYAQKGIVQLGILEQKVEDVGPNGEPIVKWELVNAKDDPEYIVPNRKDVIQALGHCLRLGDDIDGQDIHLLLKELMDMTTADQYLQPREIGAIIIEKEDGSVNSGSLVYRLSSDDADGKARFVTFPSGADFNSIKDKITNLETKFDDLNAKLDNKYDKTGGDLAGTIRFVIPKTNAEGTPEYSKKDFIAITSEDASAPESTAVGTGIQLKRNGITGLWTLSIDNVIIRRSMYVPTLIIDETKSVGGTMVVSPGHGKITRVVEEELNGTSYWRCFIDQNITYDEEGNPSYENSQSIQFDEGDFVKCAKYSGGILKSYWLPLSSVDKTNGSYLIQKFTPGEGEQYNIPAVDDETVVFGNAINPARQSLIMITGAETNAPLIATYDGLNQNNNTRLAECLIIAQGRLDGINAEGFGILKGVGFYSRGNSYFVGRLRVLSGDGTTTAPVPCNKGNWNPIETYYVGDEVTYLGELWRFLGSADHQTTKGDEPANPLWLKVVEKGEQGEGAYVVEVLSSAGNIFRNGNIATTLTAIVRCGADNINDLFDPSEIRWERVSERKVDQSDDADWTFTDVASQSYRHTGFTLPLTRADVTYKAVFNCYAVNDPSVTNPAKIAIRKLSIQ